MLLLACFLLQAQADAAPPGSRSERLELPAIFADHMVLQRDQLIPIWGRGLPGRAVSVRLAEQVEETRISPDGTWSVWFEDLPAGGPHVLEVSSRQKLRFEDVWVGEVWAGVGHAGMAAGVRACADAEVHVAQADYPQIRFFREDSPPANSPQWKGSGSWVVCNAETLPAFSATLFFFGVELSQRQQVPVGLISAALGGTPLQAWVREEALRNSRELKAFVAWADNERAQLEREASEGNYEREFADWEARAAQAKERGEKPPKRPANPLEVLQRQGGLGGLYHGKLAPFAGYGLRGFLLQQGEFNGNARGVEVYEYLLRLFVRDLRKAWRRPDLPVVWLQTPRNNDPGVRAPELREAMRRALAMPDTGMVVTFDLTDPSPSLVCSRAVLGQRLADWAMVKLFGADGSSSGPLWRALERREGALALSFASIADGLQAEGDPLGFEVLDSAGVWHKARAKIEGGLVVVRSAEVAEPQAARYAWSQAPKASLFNSAGQPASPFTTVVE